MLEAPYRRLALWLIATSLPSYAYGMEYTRDQNSFGTDYEEFDTRQIPIKKFSFIDQEWNISRSIKSSSRENFEKGVLESSIILDFHKDKDLVEDLPISYKFLIAEYSGDEALPIPENRKYSGLQTYDEVKAIEKEIQKEMERLTIYNRDEIPNLEYLEKRKKPNAIPTEKELRAKFKKLCGEYCNLHTDFSTALKEANENLQDKKLSDILKERKNKFEEKQIFFIRKFAALSKHGYSATIIKLNNLLERGNNDEISFVFNDEISTIQKIIYKPDQNSKYKAPKKNKKSEVPIRYCYLGPKDLKLAIRNMEKLLYALNREYEIQQIVNTAYMKDYKPATEKWTFTGWYTWYYDTQRTPVTQEIEDLVNQAYPSNPYRLRLISQAMFSNYIDFIEERDLCLYSEKDVLYFRIKGKESYKIEKLDKTCTLGLETKFYYDVLDKAQNNELLIPKNERKLLNFASLCGYLPDTISTRATLRAVGKSQEIFDILQEKKSKRELLLKVQESKNISHQEIAFLEDAYKNLQKTEEKSKHEEEKLINEARIMGHYFTMGDGDDMSVLLEMTTYPHKMNVGHFYLSDDISSISYGFVYPHKKGMLPVFQELHKTPLIQTPPIPVQQELSKLDFEYESKELEKYKDLYKELECILNEHISFLCALDSDIKLYYYVIPSAFSAYQSEAYLKDELPEELNLAFSKLTDDSFLSREHEGFLSPEIEKKCSLDKFKKVTLSYNEITGRRKLTFSPELEELNIRSNKLISMTIVSGADKLKTLDASTNSLLSLEGLKNCTSLTKLNLSHNDLDVDREMRSLSHLTSLNLSWNKFKSVANIAVETLQNLTYLDFCHNEIDSLVGIEIFTNLTEINVSHNQLTTLAPLAKLTVLEKIIANDNLLRGSITGYFPAQGDVQGYALGLPYLRYLDISNNSSLNFSPSYSQDLKKENYKAFLPKLMYLKVSNGDEFVWGWEEENEGDLHNK